MRVLIDLSLIAALFAMSYFADGWWALLAFMPFILLLVRHNPEQKTIKKTVVSKESERPYRYYVTTYSDHTVTVESQFPVQIEGAWAHFSDDVNEYCIHVKQSFYMPQRIQLLDPAVEPTLRSVE